MMDKELKKLNRAELLEILLAQQKEIDDLKTELRTTQNKLKDRQIILEDAGSIAEAAMQLTGIFDKAQKTAELYLENVRRKADEEYQQNLSVKEENQDDAHE
jgi:hypothetical protein